jgi:hypothetical protein
MVRSKLRPQSAHVHIDGAGAAEKVESPHLLEQLPASEDLAGMLRETQQQPEFSVSEIEGSSAQSGCVGPVVDDQITEAGLPPACALTRPTWWSPLGGGNRPWSLVEHVVHAVSDVLPPQITTAPSSSVHSALTAQ